MKLDQTDRKILSELQQNAHLTNQDLGERLNLSPSQAGRRRQRLEADGIITGYTARLSARSVGLSVQAFIRVQMASHAPDQVRVFTKTVERHPEITDAWTLTGEADYLLRVYCADLRALNTLIQDVLLPIPAVARVQSQIVMDQLKSDASLPTWAAIDS
ncbi:MAG: Lrp/AsnC family transcriptional regulator [Paracoccaceae bacterium]|nr:Lrp/AsnC family transcriptional regulator [Paracoccaceae bacterium]